MTMPPEDLTHLRTELRDFNFAEAMILLGWSRPASKTTRSLEVNGETFSVRELATLGGARILEVTGGSDPTTLPDEATRRKVSDKALDIAREHVLVFVNADRTQSHWFWVKRELIDGKAKAQSRTHTYVRGQPDDLFISKLAGLFVDIGELDTSGNIAVTTVAQRLSRALDSEAVVKRFYNEFKDRRESFAEQIQGYRRRARTGLVRQRHAQPPDVRVLPPAQGFSEQPRPERGTAARLPGHPPEAQPPAWARAVLPRVSEGPVLRGLRQARGRP